MENSVDLVFEEQEKTKEITFDILQRSMKLRDVSERKFPVTHSKLFATIAEMLDKAGQNYEINQLFVTRKGTKQPDQEEVDQGKFKSIYDVNGTSFSNVLGRISIISDNPEKNMAVGISYNPKGFAICVGTNITVCSNMSILGGEYIANYGANGATYEEILVKVGSWIKSLDLIKERNDSLLEAFNQITLLPDDLIRITGHFNVLAVLDKIIPDYGDTPFNISQHNEFVRQMFMKAEGDDPITLYDVYNVGTYILTHQENIEARWSSVALFTDAILELFHFNENAEENIIDISGTIIQEEPQQAIPESFDSNVDPEQPGTDKDNNSTPTEEEKEEEEDKTDPAE